MKIDSPYRYHTTGGNTAPDIETRVAVLAAHLGHPRGYIRALRRGREESGGGMTYFIHDRKRYIVTHEGHRVLGYKPRAIVSKTHGGAPLSYAIQTKPHKPRSA